MGSPEKPFTVGQGLDKETPCHPLLFVLATDLLHTLLNSTKDLGLLTLPLSLHHNQDFPILQYADDTLIFMQGSSTQFIFQKALLNTFAESTGLRVNYTKSMMVSVNVSQSRLSHPQIF